VTIAIVRRIDVCSAPSRSGAEVINLRISGILRWRRESTQVNEFVAIPLASRPPVEPEARNTLNDCRTHHPQRDRLWMASRRSAHKKLARWHTRTPRVAAGHKLATTATSGRTTARSVSQGWQKCWQTAAAYRGRDLIRLKFKSLSSDTALFGDACLRATLHVVSRKETDLTTRQERGTDTFQRTEEVLRSASASLQAGGSRQVLWTNGPVHPDPVTSRFSDSRYLRLTMGDLS
jgi:hypothetical protein